MQRLDEGKNIFIILYYSCDFGFPHQLNFNEYI